ncbi:glycosyltransferase family protein [Candidatus Kaiserbacteria bacterium]|nr:glycosyltransferase family protein [Candidatus Kaiserbacteria bacterium]
MTGAIIQARMSSTRLPGKVMLPLSGEPVLYHVVERTKRSRGADEVIVATTVEREDDTIAEFCQKRGYVCFRGSRDDVLGRFLEAARASKLDTIVRITSDCPLIDPDIIDETIRAYERESCDYLSNVGPGERTFPRGLDCEVFSFEALSRANTEAREEYEREHVTPFMHENKKGSFRIGPQIMASGPYARPQYRLTLDYPEDYQLFQHLFERFYRAGEIISVPEVIAYLDEHPEIVSINAAYEAEYPRQGIRR